MQFLSKHVCSACILSTGSVPQPFQLSQFSVAPDFLSYSQFEPKFYTSFPWLCLLDRQAFEVLKAGSPVLPNQEQMQKEWTRISPPVPNITGNSWLTARNNTIAGSWKDLFCVSSTFLLTCELAYYFLPLQHLSSVHLIFQFGNPKKSFCMRQSALCVRVNLAGRQV